MDKQEEIVDFPKIELLPDIYDQIKEFIKKNGFIIVAHKDHLGLSSSQALEYHLKKLFENREIKRERRPIKVDGKRGRVVWVYILNEK